MKKLNNKGVTLAELIVSFALVSVSVIYFYQTIYTVRKLYKEADNRTSFLVEESYSYRIIDQVVKESTTCEDVLIKINNYSKKDDYFKAKVNDCNVNNKLSFIKFKLNDIDETYYFYKK